MSFLIEINDNLKIKVVHLEDIGLVGAPAEPPNPQSNETENGEIEEMKNLGLPLRFKSEKESHQIKHNSSKKKKKEKKEFKSKKSLIYKFIDSKIMI